MIDTLEGRVIGCENGDGNGRNRKYYPDDYDDDDGKIKIGRIHIPPRQIIYELAKVNILYVFRDQNSEIYAVCTTKAKKKTEGEGENEKEEKSTKEILRVDSAELINMT